MEYKWLDGDDLIQLEPILEANGWTSLNGRTCRALCAFEDGKLVGFSVFQMFPLLGPFYVDPNYRGTDKHVAETMAAHTYAFMESACARGFIAIADSPHTAKLCSAFGMKQIESPVYLKSD